MHGRLKVRSSEEEIARKKKEQALKVKAYRAAMGRIQTKRAKQEYDSEMLTLTGQILLRNPDVATLWNIRRECILKLTAEKASEELNLTDEDKQRTTTDVAARQAVFDGDLTMTEQCLMVNPKSYGGWHQRCWVLENCPKANWERELQLCNKYLKMDERNFHTWDYRRYVVAKAGADKQQELDYCTEMIKRNFSNYSSWHHRSLLLPLLYPDDSDVTARRAMHEDKLKEELEMVLTAAFTDPNDSSAWFYQRWLLDYSRPELDVCVFRINAQRAVLAFTKPVARSDFDASITDFTPKINWQALHNDATDTTWVAPIEEYSAAVPTLLHIKLDGLATKQFQLVPCATDNGSYYFKSPNCSAGFSASVLTELESQLESCNSLLEFEPDSKWTLLTASLLMRAIDSNKYHTKTLEYMQQLQKVDVLRAGYYKDLASKWLLEEQLEKWWQASTDFPRVLNLTALQQLTSICYEQYMCIADVIELPEHLEKVYAKKLHAFATL